MSHRIGPEPAHPEARILVVDDDPASVELVCSILQRGGYAALEGTTDPREAIEIAVRCAPNLLILDLHMGAIDGHQVIEQLRGPGGIDADTPVLVVTGDTSPSGRRRALATGANDLIAKPFDAVELVLRANLLLATHFLHRDRRRYAADLEQAVEARTRELVATQDETLGTLALVAEYRDDATYDHAVRVGRHSELLAAGMGLDGDEGRLISQAAQLHDIGKLGLPDELLLKPGIYTSQERSRMQMHTEIGHRILARASSPVLRLAAVIARSHHERVDGTGYPDRTSADQIPLPARIVAVADVFDALAHPRPYKSSMPVEQAAHAIVTERGHHFDPDVVEAFTSLDHAALVVA